MRFKLILFIVCAFPCRVRRAVRAAAPAANDRCRYLRHAGLQLEWKRNGGACATRAA
ncbi:hypothetical protein GSH03_01340 [Burkholderia pseudomallei]|nr:hypothetical protein [Burkholderia pseudomallei]